MPTAVQSVVDHGATMPEHRLKEVLKDLNSGMHFDLGGAHNLNHPRIGEWQGVFHQGRHLTAMSRGVLPEFNVYAVRDNEDGIKVRGEILRIGWRTTLEKIVRQNVPGITWDSLCAKLNIDYKKFVGSPIELEV